MVLSKERFDRLLRDYPHLSRNFVRKMRGWLLKNREILEEKVDAVYVIFSEFKTVLAPTLVSEKLLPVEKVEQPEEIRGEDKKAASKHQQAPEAQVDYIYEQPEQEILDKLLPRYVETQVLRTMLESSAAEHAARMAAMEAATKNAGEVIDALTLHMNKVRQAAITKEIIEIVSGAASTA
jgi:F-type H+-transporting ATPase subunit gamma